MQFKKNLFFIISWTFLPLKPEIRIYISGRRNMRVVQIPEMVHWVLVGPFFWSKFVKTLINMKRDILQCKIQCNLLTLLHKFSSRALILSQPLSGWSRNSGQNSDGEKKQVQYSYSFCRLFLNFMPQLNICHRLGMCALYQDFIRLKIK